MKRNASLLAWCSILIGCGTAIAESQDLHAQLAARNAAAFEEFLAAYAQVVEQVNRRFGINYLALDNRYGVPYREYWDKRLLLEHFQKDEKDSPLSQSQKPQAEELLKSPEAMRYLEARLYLENELDKNHLLKGKRLQACEEVFETLSRTDPLLKYFFHSQKYQRSYGLLLKRVVWSFPEGVGLSASTTALDTYTVFANRTQMPMLMTLTPVAFESLAFLNSIIIHELNHVLLYKEPLATNLHGSLRMEGPPLSSVLGDPYRWSFIRKHGGTSDYPDHLLQEYYALQAQLLYDNGMPSDSPYRLLPKDRLHIERLYEWVVQQLTGEYQALIAQHPDPPILRYLKALK